MVPTRYADRILAHEGDRQYTERRTVWPGEAARQRAQGWTAVSSGTGVGCEGEPRGYPWS